MSPSLSWTRCIPRTIRLKTTPAPWPLWLCNVRRGCQSSALVILACHGVTVHFLVIPPTPRLSVHSLVQTTGATNPESIVVLGTISQWHSPPNSLRVRYAAGCNIKRRVITDHNRTCGRPVSDENLVRTRYFAVEAQVESLISAFTGNRAESSPRSATGSCGREASSIRV